MKLFPVPGYEGLYSITEDGKVLSHERSVRIVRHGVEGLRFIPESEMIQRKNHNGYMTVRLSKGGVNKPYRVHRLVMLSIKPIDGCELLDVNHKDGDKENNHLSNLEWCTRGENLAHRYRVLKQKHSVTGRIGAMHHRAMGIEAFDENGVKIHSFGALMDAERAGFLASKICLCIQGKRKTHKNLTWRKAEQ